MHGGGFFIEADTKSWLGLIQAQKPGSKAFGLTASKPITATSAVSYGISDEHHAEAWAPCLPRPHRGRTPCYRNITFRMS